ncbi:hypothetical protein BHE74_00031431 [Ensete ventricosum]|uniref:Uncharacterized protein n=1 Tax=Ensete ventricosum TaxID=4639 RepID=A0A444FA89_ENSVE|nr:hypothetical protein B296_00047429 [Ensete ventricosum]RWW19531.1 hypothetical protein GW17_00016403 [Ensete ventricosum]RWW61508.1 hypothetical protein BHE74_00031431 [Ensete ventricosum]RZS21570.1 hypothetical protein BHM03_00054219 [Ensete ventricosum]
MEIAGAGTGGAAGGVADPNRNVLHDPSKLHLEVLFILSQQRSALSILHDRAIPSTSRHRRIGGNNCLRSHRDQLEVATASAVIPRPAGHRRV